jgi:hypothetical protein
MKIIAFKLGGKMRSLVLPTNAAAWAFSENDEQGKAGLLVRMKRANEYSFLTTLNMAKEELPDLNWRSTGSIPYLETGRGLEDNAAAYFIVQFAKQSDGDWALEFERGMSEWLGQQADLSAMNTSIPSSLLHDTNDVVQFLINLSAAIEKRDS